MATQDSIIPNFNGSRVTALMKQGALDSTEFSSTGHDWDVLQRENVIIQKEDGTFLMFYSSHDVTGVVRGTSVAMSSDLQYWTIPTVGLVTYGGNTNNNLVIDAIRVVDVIVAEGQYVLVGLSGSGSALIYTSPDGITWTYQSIAVSVAGHGVAFVPSALLYVDGVYRLYYMDNAAAELRKLGYYQSATATGTYTIGAVFSEFTAAVNTKQYESIKTFQYAGSIWASVALYNSVSGVLGPLWLYRSADGLTPWVNCGQLIMNGAATTFDEKLIANSKPILINGKWSLIYVGSATILTSWPTLTTTFGVATGYLSSDPNKVEQLVNIPWHLLR